MYNMSATSLTNKDHKTQKKAYRMLEEIFGSPSSSCKDFLMSNLNQIQDLLLGSLSKASPPSQASRLKCLVHIVRNLAEQDPDSVKHEQFVYKIVPEAVLCIKATNEKARQGSYTLLVS
jgi:hypothetical protein